MSFFFSSVFQGIFRHAISIIVLTAFVYTTSFSFGQEPELEIATHELFNQVSVLNSQGEYSKSVEILNTIIKKHNSSETVVRRAYNILVYTLLTANRELDARRKAQEALYRFPDLTADVTYTPKSIDYVYDELRATMFGSLSISGPDSCRIFLDDEYMGMPPLNIEYMRVGTHELEMVKSGYQGYHKTVEVRAGDSKDYSITLIPEGVGMYPGIPKYRIGLCFLAHVINWMIYEPGMFPFIKIEVELSKHRILGFHLGVAWNDGDWGGDYNCLPTGCHRLNMDMEYLALISLKSIHRRNSKVSPYLGLGAGLGVGWTYYKWSDREGVIHGDGYPEENLHTEILPILYPFVGIEIARNRPLSLGLEVGYLMGLGKFDAEYPLDGLPQVGDISLNWFHFTIGTNIQIYF